LEGSHADGHNFLQEAVEDGAAALLVSREHRDAAVSVARGIPVFDVTDTLTGLQTLAASYRTLVNPRVVAVTGSTGKTGTKDFIASILSSRFHVHATPGNLNNHIGLPLTLLGMGGSEEVLVTEMGANHKNEIARLTEIARPEIGVVMNVGPVHLEFFHSLKGVASAKAELVELLPPEGTAVLPADDEFLEFLKKRTEATVVTVGFSDRADWRIMNLERRHGIGYIFTIGDLSIEIVRYGRHHVANAAVAAVVGSLLQVPGDDIKRGIANTRVPDGRGVLFDVDGILFVDDSYNSNPASLSAAVEAFMEIPLEGTRWLVLGDMLELGEASKELHGEAGIVCGKAGVAGLVTLGEETVELNRQAAVQRKAPPHISHFIDTEKLAAYLNGFLNRGDGVLVKGSRAMHMEKVIEGVEKLRDTGRRRVG